MSYWILFCLDQVTSCKYVLISCSLWSPVTFAGQKYFSFVYIGVIPDWGRWVNVPPSPVGSPSCRLQWPLFCSFCCPSPMVWKRVQLPHHAVSAAVSLGPRLKQKKNTPKGPTGKVAQPISQDLCQKCFSAQVICYSLGAFHCYFKGARKGPKREKWKGGKLAVGSERSPVHFWVLTCNHNEKSSSSSSVILHCDWWKRLYPFIPPPKKHPDAPIEETDRDSVQFNSVLFV